MMQSFHFNWTSASQLILLFKETKGKKERIKKEMTQLIYRDVEKKKNNSVYLTST